MDALTSQIPHSHTVASHPSSVTLINILPVEVLTDIFIYCMHSATITSLTLTRVCKRWKAITENDARIFQLIVLDDSKLSLVTSNQVSRTFLQCSKELEFDVDVRLSSRDCLLPILSPFLSSLHRWNSFRLHGIWEEYIHLHSFWSSDAGQPRLEQLEVCVVDHAHIIELTEHVQTHTGPDDLLLGPHSGTFRPYTISLTSNLLCMDIMLTKLPSPRVLVPLHFVSLFIAECSLSLNNIHPSDLLHFLTACPILEYFSFNGIIVEPTFTEAYLQVLPPVVHLPHLRSLVLRRTLCTRVILSHLDAPALKELYLEHLNVNFAFPVHDQYVEHSSSFPSMPLSSVQSYHTYAVEDGDSDDEWPDFSQSPCSDHATGMGVRSLISRSNPPLQVLEMDHADMRTKDFGWLFARARHLEDFRIVASDITDRVITMLVPCLGLMVPDVSGPIAADRPDSPHLLHQVSLPRLKSVGLFNCQRLTGAAIVQAITQRATVTDELAWHSVVDVAPLEDVAIVECSRFTAEHGAELAMTLGARLCLE